MISVLITDDSILMRKRIASILESDRRIKVVGTARNGKESIEKARELKPDVITMDVEMPVMNGLEALKVIVSEMPTPVVMFSSLTTKGAETTIKALEIGAVDFIPKPSSRKELMDDTFARHLIFKIRSAVFARVIKEKSARKTEKKDVKQKTSEKKFVSCKDLAVAIGVSTGGPKTLLKVIPNIPGDFCGSIFIAQHMPEGFTKSLAERLDSLSKITVKEAKNGEMVQPGTCYLAQGGGHLKVMKMTLTEGVMLRISSSPANALYKPSVDELFFSVAEAYGGNTIGVVLTGMGRDGTRGMKKIKSKGGICVSEDESSCIVYGMPKSVEESGLSDYIAVAQDIPGVITSLVKKKG
ncbi:MAG: chemotaxis response regulator protein-glutamate methylesterase [Vulcanimicrobiota bacterium]